MMKLKTWKQYFTLISISLLAALFIRWSIVSAYHIPSSSMRPSLIPGDFILVLKSAYGFKLTPVSEPSFVSSVERGDVILFQIPSDPEIFYIKRVIGLSGEKIEIKESKIFINEKPMEYKNNQHPTSSEEISDLFEEKEESFEKKSWVILKSNKKNEKNFGPIQLKENEYFVLGDNRESSEDSRYWGPIQKANIKGKVKWIWISLNTRSESFLKKIRWKRIGKSF